MRSRCRLGRGWRHGHRWGRARWHLRFNRRRRFHYHRRHLSFRFDNFGYCLGCIRYLFFRYRLMRLGRFPNRRSSGCCRRRSNWRFRGNDDSRRRTHNGLWRDQARRRLGRLNRSNRSGAGGNWRLGNTAGRTRRHCRRRSNGLPGRRSCSRWTRGSCRLGGFLCNCPEHVSGLGDVRQVDFGLKLLRSRTRSATRRSDAGFPVLRIVIPNALRFVHLDGAGVRFLFRDSDLQQQIENHFAFDLEFSRQVVNSNLLLHSALIPPYCPVRLRVHSILTYWFCGSRLGRGPGSPSSCLPGCKAPRSRES